MDNGNPDVSVIISAYNHENYIRDAIFSVVNQDFDSIELLVIDDGSVDSTWEEILQLKEVCEKRFINTRFEKQENHGTCYTLNRLIDLSKGRYIFGLASDDIVDKCAIRLFYDFLENNDDYALAVGENKLIDKNGRIFYWDSEKNITYDLLNAKYKSFSEYLEKENKAGVSFDDDSFGSYETLCLGNYIPNGCLIKRDIYNVIGRYSTEAPLEDYWLMLQISKYAKMKFFRQTTFFYRWHDYNTVKNKSRMLEITKKTIDYEYKLLVSQHKEIYERTSKYFLRFFKKKIIDIGILKIYKTRSIENKLLCMEIFTYKFFFKYKKIGYF